MAIFPQPAEFKTLTTLLHTPFTFENQKCKKGSGIAGLLELMLTLYLADDHHSNYY